MADRQARTKRRGDVRVELSERDRALLRALARFRLVRTSDLVALVFGNVRRDTAAARLRRLFDAGYLDVRAHDRAEENLYSLGRAGRQFIEADGVEQGRVPRGEVSHHLAVVSVWVEIAKAAEASPELRLDLFRPDWEIRERLGERRSSVVPDALVKVTLTGPIEQGVRFALEVDRGTEPISVLRRKLDAYEGLREGPGGLFGWKDFGMVVVTQGVATGRRQAIHRLMDEAWGSWFVVQDGDAPSGVLVHAIKASGSSPYDLPLRQGESRDRI